MFDTSLEEPIGYNPEFIRTARLKRESADRLRRTNELLREAAEAKIQIEASKAAKRDAGLMPDPVREAAWNMVPRSEFQRIERRAVLVFGHRLMHIRGRSKQREIALARQFICYWACRRTSLSLPQIGRLLGGRDHTTIMHSVKAYREKRSKMGRTIGEAR